MVAGERMMALAEAGTVYLLSRDEEEALLERHGLFPLAHHCERMDRRLRKIRRAIKADHGAKAQTLADAAAREDAAFRAGERRLRLDGEQFVMFMGLAFVPFVLIAAFL